MKVNKIIIAYGDLAVKNYRGGFVIKSSSARWSPYAMFSKSDKKGK